MSQSVLDDYHDVIYNMVVVEKHTYSMVSETLRQMAGDVRGISERNIRQYCAECNMKPATVSDETLAVEIRTAVSEVGSSFGRKMMTGYLASKGVLAAETRVGKILKATNEPYHRARQQGARNLNPIPYYAEYFGHKLHIDQNEKIGMFGATHVMAIDGFTSQIVSWATMPVKNNLIIYDKVYRNAVLQYGMWDQVRVDHGTEFYLSLYMQEKNAHLRGNTNRQPYIQTQSKNNHRIERMWVEVNQRFNMPIKTALQELRDGDHLEMDDSLVKFCTSELSLQLSELGLKRIVDSWNAHRIPGRGIPNQLSAASRAVQVDPARFPPPQEASTMYAADLGSALQADSVFGRDPFTADENRDRCQQEFRGHYPDILWLLNRAVNGDHAPLKDAIMVLVDLVRRHSG